MQSVVVSLRGYFGPGQAYVALSRCKTLSNLHLTDFDERCINVNKQGLAALHLMRTENSLAIPHAQWLNTDSNIKIVILNTRSLHKHAENFNSNIYLSVAHIAVYTESRLQSSSLPNVFHNYTSFSANAPAERNFIGGVVILARPQLSVSQLLNIATDKLQLVAVTIEFKPHKPFILVALYRSPTLPFTDFQFCLQQHLVTLRTNYQYPILLAGDCNVDARECTVTDIPRYVNTTTHIDGAILDHVYLTGDTSNLSTSDMACYWSDHNIITASIGTHTSVHTKVQQQSPENPKSVSTNPVVTYHKRNRNRNTVSAKKSDTDTTQTTATDAHSSAPTNRQSPAMESNSTSHNTDSVKSACEFFDGAMGPDRIQLDINDKHQGSVAPAHTESHSCTRQWPLFAGVLQHTAPLIM